MAPYSRLPQKVVAGGAASDLASVLSLLQLADSAFPSGRYTHSYGLEAFAQSGRLTSSSPASALLSLLSDSVRLVVGASDGVALACSHRAVDLEGRCDVQAIQSADQRLSAVKLAREPRDASTRLGRILLGNSKVVFPEADMSELAELVDCGASPGNHAVVCGVLFSKLGVALVEAVAAELYAFSSSWIAAAVRLGLTQHRTGQQVLRRLQPVIAEAAYAASSRSVKDIASSAPLLDVMAMRHEQADLRLFAS